MEPLFVTRIEDNMGNLLSEFSSHKREAISEQTAYLMANLMQGVVTGGTAVRLRYKYHIMGEGRRQDQAPPTTRPTDGS